MKSPLESLRAHLPAEAFAILTQHDAQRTPGSKKELATLLKDNEYTLTATVAKFDATFGGLDVPDHESAANQEDDDIWLIGAENCLQSGLHEPLRGGEGLEHEQLIPVVYSPDGVVYFIGADGLGWGQDTVEQSHAQPCADDGATMLARILLERAADSATYTSKTSKGKHGAKLAKERKLAPVKQASDSFARWWAGASGFVAEYAGSEGGGAWTLVLTAKGAKAPKKAATKKVVTKRPSAKKTAKKVAAPKKVETKKPSAKKVATKKTASKNAPAKKAPAKAAPKKTTRKR
ncbi:hypothetical protein AKJ09_03511 [Labilithrix luteola]|uniref:Uncharacterized protein n=1 Tax=Labilithrix luteola TaxID=1391654 RepID=A0A0K1PTK6_9BACT|nr:hypothetical protein [Labilithrix luteola]AKU96847.1 hypothetical protein AKJ09_03511 [Labilithrix luteola]